MQRRDRILIEKILSELQIGMDMAKGISLDAFLENEMLKRAVCMTTINIGELVKNLSDEIRAAYPQVEWRAIAGFRDLAAHKYQTLRMEDVYWTVARDYPALEKQLLQIKAED